MTRIPVLVLVLLLTVSTTTLGRKRGQKKKTNNPVTMCRYLDTCYWPYYPWCLQDFIVADTGRSILFSPPSNGLYTSGTKKQDRLGSVVLFSEEGEVMELTMEISLANRGRGDTTADLFLTVFRTMCADFLGGATACQPNAVHGNAFPLFDTCDVTLSAAGGSHFHTLSFETDGVFLQVYFNEEEIGELALPHINCDPSAPRVEIVKVAYTNRPRTMKRSPMCCN